MNFQCSEIQQYTSTSFMRYRPIIITIISLSLTDSPPFGRLASTITQQYNHLVVAVVVVGWVMVESSTRAIPNQQQQLRQQQPKHHPTNPSTTTTATKHNIQQPTTTTTPCQTSWTALHYTKCLQRSVLGLGGS